MSKDEFVRSLSASAPDASFSSPVAALWWDAKGDWAKAHTLVDELETQDAMAVHAYLHRKEGALANAEYWYKRAGSGSRREASEDEWNALVAKLLAPA